MTPAEYKATLDRLGLPVQGRVTLALLGISSRQSAYQAAGAKRVTRRVAVILRLLTLLTREGWTPDKVAAWLHHEERAG